MAVGSISLLKGKVPAGPELSTLAERFVGLVRLPYGIACLIYGFFLFGFLNSIIPFFLDSLPLTDDLARALDPLHLVTYLLSTFLLYAPHYMRSKTLEAESSISPLLENGEAGFHKLFGGISSRGPQLLTWFISAIGLLASLVLLPELFGGTWIEFTLPPTTSLLDIAKFASGIISFAFYGLAFSSLAWAYYSVQRGVHLMGSQPLRLRHYYQDSFLGLRPLGSLALSLALAYFGAVGLFTVILMIAPSPPIGAVIGISALLGTMIVLGLAMFFLPLRRIHDRMLKQKTMEKQNIAERFKPLLKDAEPGNPTEEKTQSMILDTLKLDIIDRKVSSIATWPFDFEVLGKLTLIIVSVAAALVTRVLTIFLGI